MALTLATYNVKDLFDATSSEEEERLQKKLAVLAGIVTRLDADVLALQEVSSEAVVRRLCELLPGGGGYGPPMVGTADARGIRCAILSRQPVRTWNIHTAHHLEFPRFFQSDASPFGERIPLRRGIVHAELDVGWSQPLHFLSLHFKSSRPVPLRTAEGAPIEPITGHEQAEGMLRSMVWRAAEALFVRSIVDGIHAENIVVAGDFNDVAESMVVRTVVGTGPFALSSASAIIPADQRFSVLHGGSGSLIDHMLTSFPSRLRSARLENENLVDHNQFDDSTLTLDSDHAPLVATFE